MTGETDLTALLASMQPKMQPKDYVFCSFAGEPYGSCANLEPIASISEGEGLTLVIPKDRADGCQLGYDGIFRCITLTVHSSLSAIGLTAAVSQKLAEQGIAANIFAGYFHDHVFVPVEKAGQALAALLELSGACLDALNRDCREE